MRGEIFAIDYDLPTLLLVTCVMDDFIEHYIHCDKSQSQ